MQPGLGSPMAVRKPLDYLNCSVANTLDVIGDRWTVLLLRDAFLGVRRFDDFQRTWGSPATSWPTDSAGWWQPGSWRPAPYQERPPRSEYVLTAKGKDLLDVLLALWRWGDRWAPVPDEVHRDLIHLDCGSAPPPWRCAPLWRRVGPLEPAHRAGVCGGGWHAEARA